MQTEIQNKAIGSKDAKNKRTLPKPEVVNKEEQFHFPGQGKYKTMTVTAKTREEAEQIYQKNRVEI